MRIIYTSSFKKDFKKISKQGKDLTLIGSIIKNLSSGSELAKKYRDHSLTGNHKNRRECHIKPDWLLIYEVDLAENVLVLHRTGSHSELFKK